MFTNNFLFSQINIKQYFLKVRNRLSKILLIIDIILF